MMTLPNRDSTIDSEHERWAGGDDCHDYDADDRAGEAELQERLDDEREP